MWSLKIRCQRRISSCLSVTMEPVPEPAKATGGSSNNDKFRSPQLATAAYLVKGAAAKVLSTFLTIGTKFDAKTRGSLA